MNVAEILQQNRGKFSDDVLLDDFIKQNADSPVAQTLVQNRDKFGSTALLDDFISQNSGTSSGEIQSPQADQERDYLKEAGKMFDKFANAAQEGNDAVYKFAMDLAPNKLLGDLGTVIYANSRDARQTQASLDADYNRTYQAFAAKLRDPETSIEQKRKIANLMNNTIPADIIGSSLGNLTPKKVLYHTAEDLLDTLLFMVPTGKAFKAYMSGQGLKGIVTEAIKTGGKVAALSGGAQAAESMADNKPLESVAKDAGITGAVVGGITAGIEAGIPGMVGANRLVGKAFSSLVNRFKKVGADPEKLVQDLAKVTEGVSSMAPDSQKTGEAVVDALTIQREAARQESRANLNSLAAGLEKEYNPAISLDEVGNSVKNNVRDWKQSEKEISRSFFNDQQLADGKFAGSSDAYLTRLQELRDEMKNVPAPLKEKINTFISNATEIDKGAMDLANNLRKSGYDEKTINETLKASGLSTALQPKKLSIKEKLDTKQEIDQLVRLGDQTYNLKPKDAKLVSLSMSLKKDIEQAMNLVSPEKSKAYQEELARYGTFMDNLDDVRGVEFSDDPLGTILKMDKSEVSTLYKLKSFEDNMAQTQDGLAKYMIEKSKENGVLNPAKLESYINQAFKNGSLPAEDLAKLNEYKDLQTVLQGSLSEASAEQKAKLTELLGGEATEAAQKAQIAATKGETAFEQATKKTGVDKAKLAADTIVDNISKMKSFTEFSNVWNRLEPGLQKDISSRVIANGFGEGFVTSTGDINVASIKSYLEGIGIGAGNKPQIVKALLNDGQREALGEFYNLVEKAEQSKTISAKLKVEILQGALGIAHAIGGSKALAIFHLSKAFPSKGTVTAEMRAEEIVSKMMENFDEAAPIVSEIKPTTEKINDSLLFNLGNYLETGVKAGASKDDTSGNTYDK